MPEESITYLLTQGVLGVTVVTLSYVVGKLYNKTERLEKEKTDLLEARRVDDRETIKEVTEVLSNNAQNMRILSEKIEVGKSIERNQR